KMLLKLLDGTDLLEVLETIVPRDESEIMRLRRFGVSNHAIAKTVALGEGLYGWRTKYEKELRRTLLDYLSRETPNPFEQLTLHDLNDFDCPMDDIRWLTRYG